MASASQDVRELKDQVNNMEKMLKAHVKENGNGSSVAKIEDFAHHAGENLRSLYDQKSQQLHELRDEASGRIAKRPLTSAAAAFGAGVLLTALLRRS